jgi:uncharacterized protein Usg
MTSELERSLQDYRLTTAEILYHFPDYPTLLQSFIWQELDLAPKFPVLTRFLGFWQKEIEGKLHSVIVTHTDLVMPQHFRFVQGSMQVH